jgi:hypothetical protein
VTGAAADPSWSRRVGRALLNPLGQALAFYAAFLPVALVARLAGAQAGPLLAAAAFQTLFSVVNPATLVFAPRFWIALLLSPVAWLLLFGALAITVDAIEPMREGAMVFLGAMMVFPPALLVAGIVRLVRRGRVASRSGGALVVDGSRGPGA